MFRSFPFFSIPWLFKSRAKWLKLVHVPDKILGIIRLGPTRLIGPLAQVRGAQKRLGHKTNPLLHHHPTTPHNLSTTPSIISYGTPINKHHKHYEKQVPSFKKQVEKLTSISTLCIPPQTLAGTYLKVFL
jgi:hypothetical protein